MSKYEERVGEGKPGMFINAWDEQNTEDAAGQPSTTENKKGEKGAKVGSALNAAAKIVGQFTQKQDWSNLNR